MIRKTRWEDGEPCLESILFVHPHATQDSKP